jgi:hypothetical protein
MPEPAPAAGPATASMAALPTAPAAAAVTVLESEPAAASFS